MITPPFLNALSIKEMVSFMSSQSKRVIAEYVAACNEHYNETPVVVAINHGYYSVNAKGKFRLKDLVCEISDMKMIARTLKNSVN
jgi:hypothetical protein